MKPPRIQDPRLALTANIPLPTMARLDALREQLGITRHAFLIRCIDIALPLLESALGATEGTATVPAAYSLDPDRVVPNRVVPDRVVFMSEAAKLVGYSVTNLGRLEQAGKFPPRRQISPFRSGWLLSDLIIWIQSLPTVRLESRVPVEQGRCQVQATHQSPQG